MTKVEKIASNVIWYAHQIQQPITNLQLQKILYLIQGTFLASFNEPCFDDDIVAWISGPIVENIFYKYGCIYGADAIWEDGTPPTMSQDKWNIITSIIEKCLKCSPPDLAKIILNQAPYKIACLSKTKIINLSSLYSFFSENSN